MEKKKSGMKTIIFEISDSTKSEFDDYCKKRGLTMAECLRCMIGSLLYPKESTVQKAIEEMVKEKRKDKPE